MMHRTARCRTTIRDGGVTVRRRVAVGSDAVALDARRPAAVDAKTLYQGGNSPGEGLSVSGREITFLPTYAFIS